MKIHIFAILLCLFIQFGPIKAAELELPELALQQHEKVAPKENEEQIPLQVPQQMELIAFYMNKIGGKTLLDLKKRRKKENRNEKGQMESFALTDRLKEAIKFLYKHNVGLGQLTRYFHTTYPQIEKFLKRREHDQGAPRKRLSKAAMELLKNQIVIDIEDMLEGKRIRGELLTDDDLFILKRTVRITKKQQNELIQFYLWIDHKAAEAFENHKPMRDKETGQYLPVPNLKTPAIEAIKFLAHNNISLARLVKELHIAYDKLKDVTQITEGKYLPPSGGRPLELSEEQLNEQKEIIVENYEQILRKKLSGKEMYYNFYIKIIWPYEGNEELKSFRFKLSLKFKNLNGDEEIIRIWTEHYDIGTLKLPGYFNQKQHNGRPMELEIWTRYGSMSKQIEFNITHGKFLQVTYDDVKGIKYGRLYDLEQLYPSPKNIINFQFVNIGQKTTLHGFKCGTAAGWTTELPVLSGGSMKIRNKFVSKASVTYEGQVCEGDKYQLQIISVYNKEPIAHSVICEPAPLITEKLEYVIGPDYNFTRKYTCALKKNEATSNGLKFKIRLSKEKSKMRKTFHKGESSSKGQRHRVKRPATTESANDEVAEVNLRKNPPRAVKTALSSDQHPISEHSNRENDEAKLNQIGQVAINTKVAWNKTRKRAKLMDKEASVEAVPVDERGGGHHEVLAHPGDVGWRTTRTRTKPMKSTAAVEVVPEEQYGMHAEGQAVSVVDEHEGDDEVLAHPGDVGWSKKNKRSRVEDEHGKDVKSQAVPVDEHEVDEVLVHQGELGWQKKKRSRFNKDIQGQLVPVDEHGMDVQGQAVPVDDQGRNVQGQAVSAIDEHAEHEVLAHPGDVGWRTTRKRSKLNNEAPVETVPVDAHRMKLPGQAIHVNEQRRNIQDQTIAVNERRVFPGEFGFQKKKLSRMDKVAQVEAEPVEEHGMHELGQAALQEEQSGLDVLVHPDEIGWQKRKRSKQDKKARVEALPVEEQGMDADAEGRVVLVDEQGSNVQGQAVTANGHVEHEVLAQSDEIGWKRKTRSRMDKTAEIQAIPVDEHEGHEVLAHPCEIGWPKRKRSGLNKETVEAVVINQNGMESQAVPVDEQGEHEILAHPGEIGWQKKKKRSRLDKAAQVETVSVVEHAMSVQGQAVPVDEQRMEGTSSDNPLTADWVNFHLGLGGYEREKDEEDFAHQTDQMDIDDDDDYDKEEQEQKIDELEKAKGKNPMLLKRPQIQQRKEPIAQANAALNPLKFRLKIPKTLGRLPFEHEQQGSGNIKYQREMTLQEQSSNSENAFEFEKTAKTGGNITMENVESANTNTNPVPTTRALVQISQQFHNAIGGANLTNKRKISGQQRVGRPIPAAANIDDEPMMNEEDQQMEMMPSAAEVSQAQKEATNDGEKDPNEVRTVIEIPKRLRSARKKVQ